MSVIQASLFGSPAYYCERCGRQLSNPISMMAHRGPICRHKGTKQIMSTANLNLRDWGQRFDYKGYGGCDCHCYIQRNGNVIMATEAPDNDGTSITNMAEGVADAVCRELGIRPIDLIWIEHYPKRGQGHTSFSDTFDLVSFQVVPNSQVHELGGDRFSNPKWVHLPKAQALTMAGLQAAQS